MKKNFSVVLILSAMFIAAACTKTEEPSGYVKPDTPQELIMAGSWKMSSARFKIDNGEWFDFYGSIPECLRNNVLSFPTTDVFVEDEGDTKCNAADPQKKEDGNWGFKWNESKIVYSTPIFDTAVKVYDTTEQILLSLTEDHMIIKYTEATGSGGIRTNEITYRH